MSQARELKHFYIPEEQSIYLLSSSDAKKLRDWVDLCISELQSLGYRDIEMIGKGAYGFAFAGLDQNDTQLVFKFSRINLPQHVQDRLEEEAYMLKHVLHPLVPPYFEYQQIKRQSILVMGRAQGVDLEQYSLKHGPLSPRLIVKIAVQLGDILLYLRRFKKAGGDSPIVHGDIKPSNIVIDESRETIGLIDWGSSVFAQVDESGQVVGSNVMDLMSGDLQNTNARLGDVYFIGDDQLNGGLSTPRFDEQGMAGTLYALASGQSCRFGAKVITPESLGLPKLLASILSYMLSDDAEKRRQGGDYFFSHLHVLRQIVFVGDNPIDYVPSIPTWLGYHDEAIDTVVYSSRKSFLRQQGHQIAEDINYLNDAQFDRYYKQYLQGMGATEKAFIAAVSRLGRYPVVGGMAIRWEPEGIYVDSSLNLYDHEVKAAFELSVNTIIDLARAIHRPGIFKCCLFNAKDTLHIERDDPNLPFMPTAQCTIPFELSRASVATDESRMHSYFEDGDDPDELLALPEEIIQCIEALNEIHHTGCIIFEALPHHLKIHSYYMLLDHKAEHKFNQLLHKIVECIPKISGVGISGFMKLPYKDTRLFEHRAHLPEKYYPRNPRAELGQ